jgi:hypothetical protein
MKSSFKTLIAVGALALAAGQASASTLVHSDASFVLNERYTNIANLASNQTVDDLYKFTASDAFTSSSAVLGFQYDGGPVSVKDLTMAWSENGAVLATKVITDSLGAVIDRSNVYFNMIAGKTYELLVTGVANSQGGTYSVTVAAVPLPGAALLFGSALLGMAGLRRKSAAAKEMTAV